MLSANKKTARQTKSIHLARKHDTIIQTHKTLVANFNRAIHVERTHKKDKKKGFQYFYKSMEKKGLASELGGADDTHSHVHYLPSCS